MAKQQKQEKIDLKRKIKVPDVWKNLKGDLTIKIDKAVDLSTFDCIQINPNFKKLKIKGLKNLKLKDWRMIFHISHHL